LLLIPGQDIELDQTGPEKPSRAGDPSPLPHDGAAACSVKDSPYMPESGLVSISRLGACPSNMGRSEKVARREQMHANSRRIVGAIWRGFAYIWAVVALSQ